jgi:NRPS condensation-like uncharacterized protein
MTARESRYFEFSPTDRALAALYDASPFVLQLGVELDDRLDHARLEAALRLLARRHPILGATLARAGGGARWQPRTTAPELVELLDQPGDGFVSASGFASLHSQAFDRATGPTCRLTHIHGTAGSRLVFALDHAVGDGTAMLLLLDDLRRIYVALEVDDPPVVDVDWSPRTLTALLKENGVTLDERVRMGWEAMQRWGSTPRSTHLDTTGAAAASELEGSMTFEEALVETVEARSRRRGWRFNHVMLALLARAWHRVVGEEPAVPSVSGWLVTVDCRRQFGTGRGTGNLSGFEPVSLSDVGAKDLFDVIEDVRVAFAPLGRRGAGLVADLVSPWADVATTALLDRSVRDTFALRTAMVRSTRLYTHTDRLPTSLGEWGHTTATALHWLPPRHVEPPYVAMLLVRFGGVTRMTPFAARGCLSRGCALALGDEMRSSLAELDRRL